MPTVNEVMERYDRAIEQGDESTGIMLGEIRDGYHGGYVSATHLLIALESAEKRIAASRGSGA